MVLTALAAVAVTAYSCTLVVGPPDRSSSCAAARSPEALPPGMGVIAPGPACPTEAFWTDFLRGLVKRGLVGVQLAISDPTAV